MENNQQSTLGISQKKLIYFLCSSCSMVVFNMLLNECTCLELSPLIFRIIRLQHFAEEWYIYSRKELFFCLQWTKDDKLILRQMMLCHVYLYFYGSMTSEGLSFNVCRSRYILNILGLALLSYIPKTNDYIENNDKDIDPSFKFYFDTYS